MKNAKLSFFCGNDLSSSPSQLGCTSLCAKTRAACHLRAERLCLCILHPPPPESCHAGVTSLGMDTEKWEILLYSEICSILLVVAPYIYTPRSVFSQPETLESFWLMLTPTNYKGRNSRSKVKVLSLTLF